MAIGTALRTLILSDSDITDHIGTRCHPVVLPPESSVPAITYRQVSGAPQPALGNCPDTTLEERFQFDIYATTYLVVEAIKDAMLTLMQRYDGTVSAKQIIDIMFDLGFDVYEDETNLYRKVIDARIMYVH